MVSGLVVVGVICNEGGGGGGREVQGGGAGATEEGGGGGVKVGMSEGGPGHRGVAAVGGAEVLGSRPDDGSTQAAGDASQVFCAVALVFT